MLDSCVDQTRELRVHLLKPTSCAGLALLLCACAANPIDTAAPEFETSEIRQTVHRNNDDLLSAGLGMAGLRAAAVPQTDTTPDARQLRRIAIHANYKALADLTATGGFAADAELPVVPGREFQAFIRLPGVRQPIRALLQVPDRFNPDDPCLVVAPGSGSRGIYGGLPVAGPWALPRGCALASTDKGAGTDLFDHSSDTGVTLAGTRAGRESELGFEPDAVDAALVSVPHIHSGDNPEADWGLHTIVTTLYALDVLTDQFPDHRPFTPERVRVIAAAISNGGSAVLRALEQAAPDLFDAAVVAAPNITPPGARPLYDYATQAALFQPCLLADLERLVTLPFGNPVLAAAGQVRCASLADAGLIETATPAAARAALEESGFDNGALDQAAVNATLDLWRSVGAMYASAYLATPADRMPCGYATAVVDDNGRAVAADPARRLLWWAVSSGVVPGGGVEWIDTIESSDKDDPSFPGLRCLRRLWTGEGEQSGQLRRAVEATRASAELPDIPVVLLHGRQDGLIPAEFSARPYVAAARENGVRQLAYWEIDGAQHFDVIVPFPGVSNRYRPLLPFLWEGMNHVDAVLDGNAELGENRVIEAIPAN